MNELLLLGCGVLLAEIAQWLIRFWRQREDRQRRAKARQVLNNHGLTPQLYLATIGEDDAELRAALDAFAFTGHIITNAKGEVVGKLCPRVEDSTLETYSHVVEANSFSPQSWSEIGSSRTSSSIKSARGGVLTDGKPSFK